MALGLVAGLVSPVLALDGREAEMVVGIMEALAADSGDSVYFGGGPDLFEYDAVGEGLIPAAGLDENRWSVLHDEVVAGYMATIPQERFDAVFDAVLERLNANTTLSEEQKAIVREDMAPQISEAYAARKAGLAHAETMRPLASRMQALVFGTQGF